MPSCAKGSRGARPVARLLRSDYISGACSTVVLVRASAQYAGIFDRLRWLLLCILLLVFTKPCGRVYVQLWQGKSGR